MASPVKVKDLPVSLFGLNDVGGFFPRVSCIAATAVRVLSALICSPVAENTSTKDISRCKSPSFRMERIPSTPAYQKIDDGTTGTSSAAADDVDVVDAIDGDDDLFAPIPPRPECPICMHTLPLMGQETMCMSCCGNVICAACIHARERVIEETNATRLAQDPHDPCLLESNCPLCREATPKSFEEEVARLRERMGRDRAYAFSLMGQHYQRGCCGLKKNNCKAFELYLRAAELGNVSAKYLVAESFCVGDVDGIEKDIRKGLDYLVSAAKGGCVVSRYTLGKIVHSRKGKESLAYKHWEISASFGCDSSMHFIRRGLDEGLVTEDEYERVKHDHQKAIDEMKSEARDKYVASKRDEEKEQEGETKRFQE